MRFSLIAAFALGAAACLAADDPKPSPLDKLDAKKVPVGVRPAKGSPPEVLAVMWVRGDRIDCLAFRPDGRFLALSGADKIVRIWDLEGVKPATSWKHVNPVTCLVFTPDRKTIVVGDSEGGVKSWEKGEKQNTAYPKAAITAHKDGPVWGVAVSPDGKTLATGGRDKAVRLWDMTKPKLPLVASLTEHEEGVRAVAFTPDGSRLVSVGGKDGQLRVWELTGGKPRAGAMVKLPDKVAAVAVSADGSLVATGGAGGSSRVWAFKDGRPESPVDLDTGGKAVRTLEFSPDGSLLVGIVDHSDTEDRVRVWGKDGAKKREFRYDLHTHAVGFAPDGRHLAVVTEFGTRLVRLPK